MFKILLVEDDATITLGIEIFLKKNNFSILAANTLVAAKQSFSDDIDLILLDLNLPDGNGYDFCNYIKNLKDVPVIFLTVRDEEADMVKGLDMGADDYISKPFKLSVLLSRINAVLRRVSKNQLQQDILTCCDIKLIKSQTKVYKNEKEIILTAGEYKLLLLLFENKNCTLTRASLLEKLWDIDGQFINDNTLSVTMKRLREKLDNTQIIKTIRGIGYRVEE
jgi:DNA-binding response OmpR family regulator